METIIRKKATNLTPESVSILTQEFEITLEKETQYETKTETKYRTEYETQIQEQDGEQVEVQVEVEVPYEVEVEVPVEVEVEKEVQIGSNHRCAYSNTESGRAMLAEKEPADIVAEVMEVWGLEPTIEEPTFDENYVPEPTLNDRVAALEETLANGSGSSDSTWEEIAAAIESGVNEL